MNAREFIIIRTLAATWLLVLCACETNVRDAEPAAQPGAAEVNDTPEQLLVRAGEAYDEKEWRAAEGYYRQLTQRLPTEAQPWFRLGNIYARTERPEFAVAAYREALVRDPQLSKSWYNMGIVQLRQAANSFLQMQTHTAEESPEHLRAKAMYESIIEFIRTGPPAPAADPPP